jgi:hypothetical protein
MQRLTNRLVEQWLLEDTPETADLEEIQELTAYLSEKLYEDYEPCQFERFEDRLDAWISNVGDDNDKKTLYLLLKQIFFVGRREFESLCRAAFHGPITRWLLDSAGIALDDPEIVKKFRAAIDETWFCPVTDSMRINAFFKVIGVNGRDLQPDWRSLRKFGDQTKIKNYFNKHNIKRLVLLEDFVGTGIQMSKAIEYAAALDPKIQLLVCPLIICPEGIEKANDLLKSHANLRFSPVLSLSASMFIKSEARPTDQAKYAAFRDLIDRTALRLSPKTDKYTTHGFEDSGATVVLYSNCPDNTLPIIHETADDWRPLFPRIERG